MTESEKKQVEEIEALWQAAKGSKPVKRAKLAGKFIVGCGALVVCSVVTIIVGLAIATVRWAIQ